MIDETLRRSGRGHVWLIVGYLCGYVALDWISYLYPVAPPLAITPWNPQQGLSLALLLRTGLRNAPWLFVASLCADLLVRGLYMSPLLSIAAAAVPAIAYTLLAALLRGALHLDPDFRTLREATILLGTVTVGTALLSMAFVTAVDLAGYLPAGTFGKSAAQYWIGDLIGIVVTTPLLLVFTRPGAARFTVPPLEAALQIATVVAAIWVVFGSDWSEELKLFYILFLPLVWIAMRDGIEGTTIAIAITQIGLIVAMRLGGYPASAVLEFQILLLAVAVTGLFLGLTVSERREIALQLRDKQLELDRSMRLTAASEMASSLAHELNQPLTAIGSYVRSCQIMIDGGEQGSALKDTMDKVVREVTRAGDVVRQLRDFFRTGSGHLVATSVQDLVQSAVATARPRLERHNVEWRVDIAPELPAVLVDRIQAETVLHNLIANAVDALSATTDRHREIVLSAAIEGSEFVSIGVADNGPGVRGDIAPKLFQPFETSKPHGMGLGLAISRSIIEARGGRMWLQPVERGSMFCFTLPVVSTAT